MLNSAGLLYIGFNKPIIEPPIRNYHQEDRRFLSESYYEIGDIINIKVLSISGENEKDQLNITDLKLMEIGDNSMKIQINFKKPEFISQDISEPDKLQISCKLCKVFIDT